MCHKIEKVLISSLVVLNLSLMTEQFSSFSFNKKILFLIGNSLASIFSVYWIVPMLEVV